MNYDERLENVTVLGAAGKMGSGILLLTAVEMLELSMKPENKDKTFVLNALDVSKEGLAGLMNYLRVQVRKIAEKKAVVLRKVYADRADLIENEQIIDQYIFDVMNIVRPTTRIEAAYESNLVFEAVIENIDLKTKLLTSIDTNNSNNPWYFTNTSSIPIHEIDKSANLGGRILGFHFYNPPAVQRLVEIITPENVSSGMIEFAKAYAKNLRKVVVPSNDFAGFIGNGHFMRDALYAIQTARKLAENMPLVEAIYMVNRVAQNYLVRPMGIFQLIDYVGVDVVKFIMSVMNPYLDEDLHSELLDAMFEKGVKGGQFSSGAQKDGFLKYEKGAPVAVYDLEKSEYISIADFKTRADEKLGDMPASAVTWKSVIRKKNKMEVLGKFFTELKTSGATGAKMAVEYGQRSCAIGKKLVADNVAHNDDDVNTVMLTGFFHAYGPINEFF